MAQIERLEFPKKYSIPGGIKLGVIILIVVGIYIHNCSQRQLTNEVRIDNVNIAEYSKMHVEVQYVIQNKAAFDRAVWLLLKVYTVNDEEVGSTLFMVNAKAGKRQAMTKVYDKLLRTLSESDNPLKATVKLYTRKVI